MYIPHESPQAKKDAAMLLNEPSSWLPLLRRRRPKNPYTTSNCEKPSAMAAAPASLPPRQVSYLCSLLLLALSFLPFHVSHFLRRALSYLPPAYRLPGTVTLVGAGPGDPNLLTLAAHSALRTADVVISDLLVPTSITRLTRGTLLLLPRHTRPTSDAAQSDANAWMIAHALKGLRVVRLKGGDPFVFGRGGEELLYLRKRGVEPTVVPGISSCVAAGSTALVPLTHRGLADQFLVVTGRGRGGRAPHLPPFNPRRTLVIMMGMARLPGIVDALLSDAAYPPRTPVAVVERATWTDQRVVTGTLEDIINIITAEGVGNPAVVYIGSVVLALRGGLDEELLAQLANDADEGIEVGEEQQHTAKAATAARFS
ncbi:tetrapyrrole methylase [Geranomyces variabilis]|nr:tetrapyrrole methylase [Geranomyces variabilis]